MIGYQVSHEQFSPSELLKYAVMAEQAGFQALLSSDHFHPWSERQGQSGFAFAWLGAAMQATSLPCGVVCAPGQRYHPAIVAQAAATLGELFEGRFWMTLGSGEALNEHITGEQWLLKADRNVRLKECFDIIKDLFAGETVTHRGKVVVQEAKLYTRPKTVPPLFGAALSETTAKWMGGWAEGLVTIYRPEEKLKKIIEAFKMGGGENKPMYLQMQLSYAHNYQDALDGAFDQWRTNILPPEVLAELTLPQQFDAAAGFIRPEDLKDEMLISADPQDFIDRIQHCIDLGFETIILHNVNREQELFIKDFGKLVLPHIKFKTKPAI
jgi:coenzyme F420-dependent glucose-6-phosphate dehydrogenase